MKPSSLAAPMSMGWLALSGGCSAPQAVAELLLADEPGNRRDEVWNCRQLVVSSLEPAARIGSASFVVIAHLAFVKLADTCRNEIKQRALGSDHAEQVAYPDLMLASTHRAVLAYPKDGHPDHPCN